ncbi:ABC transporter substrate-binding protein [soil metagenome]
MPRVLTSARPRSFVIAAVAVAALALTGCAPGSSSTPSAATATPVSGGTLTFARTAAVTSLDLHSQITSNNAFAIDKIFEPLLTFDAAGKLHPAVASAYSQSSDGLTWTFTIRNGITFSTGEKVTPADVVFSLQSHLDEKDAPLPFSAPITSIAASGSDKVVITLSTAYTPFAAEIAEFSNGIIPKDYAGQTREAFFAKPIGTGPFVVDSWKSGGDITFGKNTHYWQAGKPYVDKLVYTTVTDDNQLVTQLQAGQVDAIDDVPQANVADLKTNTAVKVDSTDSWNVEELFFNTKNKQFADVHVRRAIAYAIDKEGIVKATSFGTSKAADSLLPPTIQYYSSDIDAPSYDVAAAKKELAQSAFPAGFSTSLLVASDDTLWQQEAQAIQEELGAIGITVKIESIDHATFRDRFFAYNFDFMINSGTSDYADPNSIIEFQADPSGFSKSYWTSYSNPEVTALLKKGQTEPDGKDRAATYKQIQTLIAADSPYIPLSYPAAIKATSAKVHGFEVLPNGSTNLTSTWIEQ